MKYTDKQRIEKIKETVSKLQKYISDSGISRKDVAWMIWIKIEI